MNREDLEQRIEQLRQAMNAAAQRVVSQDPTCNKLVGQIEAYQAVLAATASEEKPANSPPESP
jgi:predicted HAD superfamily Cof-like phosphohydrolase